MSPVLTAVRRAECFDDLKSLLPGTRLTYRTPLTSDHLMVLHSMVREGYFEAETGGVAWRYKRTDKDSLMRQPAQAQETVTKVSNAELSVLHERNRQIAKGFDAAHDDQYEGEELALAAEAYLQAYGSDAAPPWEYPWPAHTWRPGTRRENLVKAAALIIARVEQCDRLKPSCTADRFSSSTPSYPLARR